MFEVGFTEIILILGIALVVLGPEKLPKVAADIGRWVGRARAMARQFKSQLDEEVIKADRDWSRAATSSSPPPKKSPLQDLDASPNRAAPPPVAETPSAADEPGRAAGDAPAPPSPADAAPGAALPPAAPAVDPGEPGHAKP
jgi:sec-independent protein translocase protein TatB